MIYPPRERSPEFEIAKQFATIIEDRSLHGL